MEKRGLSAFKENSVFRGQSQTLSEESKAPNIETFNGTVAMGRVDGTNKTELSFLKEGDSFTPTQQLGLFRNLRHHVHAHVNDHIPCNMCGHVQKNFAKTTIDEHVERREGNNYLIRVLTSLANTRYVGNAQSWSASGVLCASCVVKSRQKTTKHCLP